MSRPYLLFDAGGTVVFLSAEVFRREAARLSFDIDPEIFYRTLAELGCKHDKLRRLGRTKAEIYGDRHPFRVILEELGVHPADAETIKEGIVAVHKQRNIWSACFPWVPEALSDLQRMGYRMSVISNADGRAREQLLDGGIAHYFEEVFDSNLIGFAKPDPRLFQHACDALGLRPEDGLYIGDSIALDVLGANSFGMPAVLVDRGGPYDDWLGLRVRTVGELPALLARYPDIYHAPGAFAFPPGTYRNGRRMSGTANHANL